MQTPLSIHVSLLSLFAHLQVSNRGMGEVMREDKSAVFSILPSFRGLTPRWQSPWRQVWGVRPLSGRAHSGSSRGVNIGRHSAMTQTAAPAGTPPVLVWGVTRKIRHARKGVLDLKRTRFALRVVSNFSLSFFCCTVYVKQRLQMARKGRFVL